MKKKILVLIAPGFILTGLSILSWLLFSPVVIGKNTDLYPLKINKGLSFYAITNLMLQNQIIENAFKLKLAAKVLNLQHELKAGKYEIEGGTSSYALLKQLTEGHVAVERIAIPEGLQARQMAQILKDRVEIDSAQFMQLVNDEHYVKKLGFSAKSLEGFLFPDTYHFTWGMKPEDIISVMIREFKKNIGGTLKNRAKELGLTLVEAITLASIIEGEAVIDSERTIISAVYHNRLKRRMRLQADPTIQYIIPDGPRRLLKRDLEIDSPYNTYKYIGLPPGPINNPGLASIKAALHPAEVNYLYFVANGDGSHTFSRTLREHLRAKTKFDRFRKKVK